MGGFFLYLCNFMSNFWKKKRDKTFLVLQVFKDKNVKGLWGP